MGFSSTSYCPNVVLFCGIIIVVVYLLLKWNYSYWDRKGFKTLPGTKLFVGHLKSVVTQDESITELMNKLYKSTNEPFIGLYTLLRPILLIRDPELVRAILVKDFAHFPDRGMHHNEKYDPLSGNLASLPGDRWKQLRGKLSLTFTSGKLKAMFPTLLECGSTLQKYLEKLCENGDCLDIHEISASYATNFIASVGFGIEVDTINHPDNDFRLTGRKIFESSIANGIRKLLVIVSPRLLSMFHIKSFDPSVERFIMTVVKQNLEYREKFNVCRRDFFQLLIQLRNSGTVQLDDQWETHINVDDSQKKMSIREIAAQSFVFFAAGFETSSTTLSFCLYELAKHPEIQQRVHDEIDHVLGEHDGKITYESISELKYLEHCIEETLRRYPIISALIRHCVQDYPIPGTNHVIPKGSQVCVPAYALMRDEKYYYQQDKFDPDRFNTTNSDQIKRPYYPFGDGPRICIGMRMGKMQTTVGLVLMLQKFRFELDSDIKHLDLKFDPKCLFIAPLGRINLKIFKRSATL